MDTWVWTWGGTSFGYIDDDALYTDDGRHVGLVEYDDEEVLIFSITDGRYLGELGDSERLITKESRLNRHRRPRRERRRRVSRAHRRDRTSRVMRRGYRDFPRPELL